MEAARPARLTRLDVAGELAVMTRAVPAYPCGFMTNPAGDVFQTAAGDSGPIGEHRVSADKHERVIASGAPSGAPDVGGTDRQCVNTLGQWSGDSWQNRSHCSKARTGAAFLPSLGTGYSVLAVLRRVAGNAE